MRRPVHGKAERRQERSSIREYDPDTRAILEHGVVDNEILLARCWRERDPSIEHHLAIEMVDVFGMAGRTVFETCVWIGRFIDAWGAEHYTKVTRHEVKMHLCHTKRSDDFAGLPLPPLEHNGLSVLQLVAAGQVSLVLSNQLIGRSRHAAQIAPESIEDDAR